MNKPQFIKNILYGKPVVNLFIQLKASNELLNSFNPKFKDEGKNDQYFFNILLNYSRAYEIAEKFIGGERHSTEKGFIFPGKIEQLELITAEMDIAKNYKELLVLNNSINRRVNYGKDYPQIEIYNQDGSRFFIKINRGKIFICKI